MLEPDDTHLKDLRVLMLAYHFPPSTAAGVFRTLRFVKYLPEFGWQPMVVTISPEDCGYHCDPVLLAQLPKNVLVQRTSIRFPDERISMLARWIRTTGRPTAGPEVANGRGSNKVDLDDRRPVGRLWALARNLKDLLLNTPDPYIAWKRPALHSAFALIEKYGASAIYSSGPPHSVHLIAARLKKQTGLPWIADFRDPWARQPWGPRTVNPWGERLAGKQERNCVTRADAVVLNTGRARDEFRRAYSDHPAEKFQAIPNGYDPRMLTATEPSKQATLRRAGAPLRLCHPGSLYGRRDPRPILLALNALKRRGVLVEFEQIGPVDDGFRLQEFIQEHFLQGQTICRGSVAHAAALESMNNADLLLIVQPDTALQVPGKLYEMLMFRKPIVAVTGDGETADIVRRFEIGAVADPKDPAGIATAIDQAAGMIANSTEGWDRALAAYDGRRLSATLAELLHQVAGTKRNRTR